MLTETLPAVYEAGDSGQVGREVPLIGENLYEMLCCHTLIAS